jgi:drug/metabolite transporter (DMT)-like permease
VPGPYLRTLAGALGISAAPVLFALADVHPTAGAVWRFLYALPVLVPLCLLRPSARRSFAMSGWLPLAALSGAFFAVDMALWHHSVLLVGAGPGTLIVNTQVLWVALFGLLFLGEPPSRVFWLALPLAFAGMFLLAGGDLDGIARPDDRRGLVLAATAGVAYAGVLITLRAAARRAPIAPEAALVTQIGVALCLLTALGFAEGSLPTALGRAQHGWLALLGVGAQALAWIAITSGIRQLPGHHGALILIAQPVSSLLLGWWILDQSLTPLRVLGALAIVGAIVLAIWSEPRNSPADTHSADAAPPQRDAVP